MINFIFGVLLGAILGVLFLGVWKGNHHHEENYNDIRDYDEE